jgi:hypothetical protein
VLDRSCRIAIVDCTLYTTPYNRVLEIQYDMEGQRTCGARMRQHSLSSLNMALNSAFSVCRAVSS